MPDELNAIGPGSPALSFVESDISSNPLEAYRQGYRHGYSASAKGDALKVVEGILDEVFRECCGDGGKLTVLIQQDPKRLRELLLEDTRKVHMPSVALEPLDILGLWSILSFRTARRIGYPPAWFPKEEECPSLGTGSDQGSLPTLG